MESFEIVTMLFLTFSILAMSYLILSKIANIIESKKEPPKKEFIKTNIDEDFKLLYKILDEYTIFICDTIFIDSIDGSHIINGKEFNDATNKVLEEVYSTLSDEYVDLLKLYLDKFEEYVYEQTYSRVKKYVEEANKFAVKKSIIKDRRIK